MAIASLFGEFDYSISRDYRTPLITLSWDYPYQNPIALKDTLPDFDYLHLVTLPFRLTSV